MLREVFGIGYDDLFCHKHLSSVQESTLLVRSILDSIGMGIACENTRYMKLYER